MINYKMTVTEQNHNILNALKSLLFFNFNNKQIVEKLDNI